MTAFITTSLLSLIFLVEILRLPDRLSAVGKLFVCRLPLLFSFALPISVYGGIFISYYIMKMRNELVAFTSIGFEGRFLILRLLPFLFLLMIFHLTFNETAVPWGEKRFLTLKARYSKEEVSLPAMDYWMKRENAVFHFGSIFPEKNLVVDVEIFSLEAGRSIFIKARRGSFIGDELSLEHVRIYREGALPETREVYEISGEKFLLQKEVSETEIFALSIPELLKMKKILEREGVDTSFYKNSLYTKIIFPCLSFLGGVSATGIPYMGNVLSFHPFIFSVALFLLSLFLIYLCITLSLWGIIPSYFSIIIWFVETSFIIFFHFRRTGSRIK